MQSASFILVGVLVASQIRGFLLQMMRLFHSWSGALTSQSMILLLAEMMGMYFVSSVLLMRMSVPLQYRTIITRVLGDIKFHFYHQPVTHQRSSSERALLAFYRISKRMLMLC